MKKSISVALLIFTVVFGGGSSVLAFPFLEVEGFVNPAVGTQLYNGDGSTTFSQVDYTFFVTSADLGAKMNFLSLEFEADVFKSVGTVTNNVPADWTFSLMTAGSGNAYELAFAGTTVDVGQSLSFSVLGLTLFNQALVDSSLWSEGAIWGQSWSAGDTYHGSDGGSTDLAPVPEPATLVLLGSGLIGLICLKRRKDK